MTTHDDDSVSSPVPIQEVFRWPLDEIRWEECIRVKIDLPATLYQGKGASDPNHGRLARIHHTLPTAPPPEEGKLLIYLENLGNKHKLLVVDPHPIAPYHITHRISTTINRKSAHFLIKNDIGRFTHFDSLECFTGYENTGNLGT